MNSNLEKELWKAAALTFEQLTFMTPLSESEAGEEAGALDAAAGVAFVGPLCGKLIVGASAELLPAIAANMLGAEEAGSERQQLDALGEVANVVCGNLLPAIAGPEQVFRIQAPETLAGPASPHADDAPAAEVSMPLDEGFAHLWLFLDGERAPNLP